VLNLLSKSYRTPSFLLEELKTKKPDYQFKSDSFILKHYKYSTPLFTVIVGKSIVPKASGRNKVKRSVKRHLQHNLLSIKSGIYLFICINSQVINKSNEEISTEVNNLLSKIP
jgi:ribonuclease P protein component